MAFPARLLVLITLLIAAALAGTALAESSEATPERIAQNSEGDTRVVRSIDDPDNPYKDQYGPWDIWVWENYQPGFNPRDYLVTTANGLFSYRTQDGVKMPEGWGHDNLGIDAAGFPIPSTVAFSLNMFWPEGTLVRDIVVYPRKTDAESYRMYGAGIRPVDLNKEEIAACYSAAATQFPPVPAWLGENPPQSMMFMPGGEFVTYGELGLTYLEYPKGHSTIDYGQRFNATLFRYSAEGELLGEYDPGESRGYGYGHWKKLYWPEIDQTIDEFKAGLKDTGELTSFTNTVDGYHGLSVSERLSGIQSFTEMHSQPRELVKVWDLTGNEVDPDSSVTGLFKHYAGGYQREQLTTIYNAQVKQGITDPNAVSPFTGLDNGPRIVDPEPRFPPLFARNESDWEDTVTLVPLDDPKNPYAGQYREWDIWMLENIGAMNPKEYEYDQIQSQLLWQRIEEKTAAGEEITQEDRSQPAYKPDPNDPWKQHIIHVDDSGCIVPALRYNELSRKRWNHDLREDLPPAPTRYMMISEGIMPEQMRIELDIYTYMNTDKHRGIPQWLANAPVHRAVLVPNSDIVTLGPLGHRTEENAGLSRDELWRDTERAWYRYDGQGNLVDTYATQGNDWQVLYYPQWNDLKVNSEDQGLKVYTPAGYLVADNPATGKTKAVFDYDGTPVDPAALLVRSSMYCRPLRWKTIEHHLMMQELVLQRYAGSDN